MEFWDFLGWVSAQNLDHASVDPVLDRVGQVLDHLDEDDPRYAWMAAIEDKLLDGVVPKDRLLALKERFPDAACEQRLRHAAANAPRQRWETFSLKEIRRRLEDFDENPQAFEDLLHKLEVDLEAFWSDYNREPQQPNTPLETAGDRLLKRSYEDWKLALKALREGNFDLGLEVAAAANRILSALERMEEEA